MLGKQRLSQTLGTIFYVLLLVPVLISALNALNLEAVTAPASRMLDMMLAVIPQLFGAAVVLGIAFVIGKLVAGLVASVLAGVGFNKLFSFIRKFVLHLPLDHMPMCDACFKQWL